MYSDEATPRKRGAIYFIVIGILAPVLGILADVSTICDSPNRSMYGVRVCELIQSKPPSQPNSSGTPQSPIPHPLPPADPIIDRDLIVRWHRNEKRKEIPVSVSNVGDRAVDHGVTELVVKNLKSDGVNVVDDRVGAAIVVSLDVGAISDELTGATSGKFSIHMRRLSVRFSVSWKGGSTILEDTVRSGAAQNVLRNGAADEAVRDATSKVFEVLRALWN
ncbi:hypothetical protein [Rhodopseudomonas parapalustris]